MNRYPVNNVPARRAAANEEASPLLRLARRIREEQGAEQLKAFFAAMRPFAAPNELRRVSESFGIDPESIPLGGEPRRETPPDHVRRDPLSMIQTLMQLSGAMKGGGGDISALLNLLGGGRQH